MSDEIAPEITSVNIEPTVLTEWQYQVTVTPTRTDEAGMVEVAAHKLSENKDDYLLVISDLRMPSLKGMELLKKVKGINPNV